jgi:hypothetical protein
MPNILHLHHVNATRPTAGDPRVYQRQPSHDSPIQADAQVPYFPEGGVAAPPYMIVNPVSHGPDSFPGNGSANQLVGQAAATWLRMRDSDEQGIGVPPFKRWPRQFHSETYNFDKLSILPFPDQLGPIYLQNLNRPEKAGWSVPKYGEQYQQSIGERSVADLMQTNDPASLAFAIGWGYVG